MIIHDSHNFTEVSKSGTEKGTYKVDGDEMALYFEGHGNIGTSIPLNRANRTLSAGKGYYYKKIK